MDKYGYKKGSNSGMSMQIMQLKILKAHRWIGEVYAQRAYGFQLLGKPD
jgi:hypothetical protein